MSVIHFGFVTHRVVVNTDRENDIRCWKYADFGHDDIVVDYARFSDKDEAMEYIILPFPDIEYSMVIDEDDE